VHRLIKALFRVSDIFASLLLAFAALVTVTYPFAGPAWARMDHQQLPASSIVATCLLWLFGALGAYLITRRRAFGVLLMTAVGFVAAKGDWMAGLGLAAAVAFVFGLPLLLVLIRARPGASESAP
jgi:hypothetical protein